MAEPDIRLLVSNTGDANPSGSSAKLIRNNLQQAFHKQPAYININIRQTSLQDIRSRIESELKDITLNLQNARIGNISSGEIESVTLGDNGSKIREQLKQAFDSAPAEISITVAQDSLTNLRTLIESALENIEVTIDGKKAAGQTRKTSAHVDPDTGMLVSDRPASQAANAKVKAASELNEKLAENNERRKEEIHNIKKETAEIKKQREENRLTWEEEAHAAKQRKANEADNERAIKDASALRKLVSQAHLELERFNQYLTNLSPKALVDFSGEIAKIREGLGSGVEDQINEARNALKHFQADMKSLGYEGGNILTYLQAKFKTFATYVIASGVSMFAVARMRDVLTHVVKLDGALTDLRIVIGGTREETQALVGTYNQMAKELGSTTLSVAEAAVEWQRQGYNITDTNELLKDSMILSVVGMVESAEAAQYLTSAIKGYKVEVQNAIGIVDKLTAIDLDAAVSAGGLAEAMARTANSARLAGVDMNSLLGYIAAVGEVTQRDMATVGEAFKTLFARYSNVKLGVLVDDESGESLNDFEVALNQVGIALRGQDGQFRAFNDVLKELGERYKSLTDVQRSAIATTLGGVRQRENVLVLLENLDTAFKYAETAANSAGTAMQKFGVYEESIEYKTQRMTAAFEGFSMAVLDGRLVGFIVDLATGLLELGSSISPTVRDMILFGGTITGVAASLKMFATSPFGTSIGRIGEDLGWLEMTSDIVPIYSKKAA